MKEFTKEHAGDIVVVASFLLITVVTSILITATGKALVMEVDGLNATSQDGEGNYEERHFDGGRLKFYAE